MSDSASSLLTRLFGESSSGIRIRKSILTGYASVAGQEVCVLGTTDGTYIDNAAALTLAAQVIDCIENHPEAPIVMLVDSAGQKPNRVCEMLGLASYFGHLLACLQVAREAGHKLLTIATGKAIGGAFICYGMFADRIDALETASVGLMPIEAMAAVTKIPAATLEQLSKKMPALEFGVDAFAKLGGVESVWKADDDLQARLAEAISTCSTDDHRARLGKERGGRLLALEIQEQVLAEAAK